MRTIKAALACTLLLSAAFAQEILRPTADVDGGAVTALGCTGTNTASLAMPKAYDAAGQATSAIHQTAGSLASSRYSTRIFKSWQSTANTFSTLTLNVSSASNGWSWYEPTGNACLAYSIDGGATWTSMKCDTDGNGWAQTTSTATLSATQNLAKLQVGTCTSGSKGTTPGSDDVVVYDIWLSGATSGAAAGTGSSSGNAHRGTVIVN